MNVMARHVAFVMSRLTEEEAAKLPWHRVVSADARISPKMDAALAMAQRRRLRSEGMKINPAGYLQNSDAHFHVVGVRRKSAGAMGEESSRGVEAVLSRDAWGRTRGTCRLPQGPNSWR